MQYRYVMQYDSDMLIRELRSMMPTNRQRQPRPSCPAPVPSPSLSDLEAQIKSAYFLASARRKVTTLHAVEASLRGESFPPSVLSHQFIPGLSNRVVDRYTDSVYGGQFVGDGSRFVTSCQDTYLRVYDTAMSDNPKHWRQTHRILAHGIRWTITDFDVSPDGRWLAYASINNIVHLVDLEDTRKPQIILDFSVTKQGRRGTCVWSLSFSYDGTELIAGTRDSDNTKRGSVVVYDVQLQRIVEAISAHEEDVNSVCFMQTGDCNLVLSGSDDALGTLAQLLFNSCATLAKTF